MFFDPSVTIADLSGNLPHWRQHGVCYFVTFRTADSLPQGKLLAWREERECWLKLHPEPHSLLQRQEYWERFPARFHRWLDQGHGRCALRQSNILAIVSESLEFFSGERYLLDERVVMPNHVHVLVTPLANYELSDILHSWKSFSAKAISRELGLSGTFWQKESFDHIVRSSIALEKFRQYIRDNPKGTEH